MGPSIEIRFHLHTILLAPADAAFACGLHRAVLGRVRVGLQALGDWSYALYLIHVPVILVVYHFWPRVAGTDAAPLSAAAAAVILSAGFGTLDVWIYRRLKSAVDALDEKKRRRRTNFYAVTFIVASLIGMVV